ncbi:MAG: hypothetical protein P8016_04690 [Sedimentisphaerales bacterium]
MTEDKLKNMLRKADQSAGIPSPVEVDISAIRQRAKRRRIYRLAYPSAAAAVVIIAVTLWSLLIPEPETGRQPTQVASDEMKIRQLQASTDETVNLIREILEEEQRQQRLNELNAQLASIPDPLEEIQEELDRTAFILVYSADRMYKELNLTDSAVKTYRRVIKLFPDNQWAKVARERLEEIKNKRNNNDSSKGESKWKQQNTLS